MRRNAVSSVPGTDMYAVEIDGCKHMWWVGKRYKLESVLGVGSYGCVCRAWDRETNAPVAIKKISKVFATSCFAMRVLREVSLLRRLHHPYIVSLIDVFTPSTRVPLENIYLVFEYGGNDLNSASFPSTFNENDVKHIMKQLLLALYHLHKSNVIHRDIKPANILIDDEMHVKLADFGLARVLKGGERQGSVGKEEDETVGGRGRPADGKQQQQEAATAATEGEVGGESQEEEAEEEIRGLKRSYSAHVVTRWYRAPEVILCNGLYSMAIDVWSAGCILAELLAEVCARGKERALFPGKTCFPLSPMVGAAPRDDRDDQLNVIFGVIGTPSDDAIDGMLCDEEAKARLRKISKKPAELAVRFPKVSAEVLDLLQKMLTFDPAQRATVKDALRHSWFGATTDAMDVVGGSASASASASSKRVDEHSLGVDCGDEMLSLDLDISNRTGSVREFFESRLRREINAIRGLASPRVTAMPAVGDEGDLEAKAPFFPNNNNSNNNNNAITSRGSSPSHPSSSCSSSPASSSPSSVSSASNYASFGLANHENGNNNNFNNNGIFVFAAAAPQRSSISSGATGDRSLSSSRPPRPRRSVNTKKSSHGISSNSSSISKGSKTNLAVVIPNNDSKSNCRYCKTTNNNDNNTDKSHDNHENEHENDENELGACCDTSCSVPSPPRLALTDFVAANIVVEVGVKRKKPPNPSSPSSSLPQSDQEKKKNEESALTLFDLDGPSSSSSSDVVDIGDIICSNDNDMSTYNSPSKLSLWLGGKGGGGAASASTGVTPALKMLSTQDEFEESTGEFIDSVVDENLFAHVSKKRRK